jgi:two-component system, OmpR family, response regulator TctD
MSIKILLVEDDPALSASLARALTRLNWIVEVCADGRAALMRWKAIQPDIVLLDLSLPGRDGLNVLTQARDEGIGTPVLILTARGTVGDRIAGLNAGADDYLPKPFDLDELEARVRALHRRHAENMPSAGSNRPEWNQISYDKESGSVFFRGQVLDFTPRELALLKSLLARPGLAVSKERLFRLVFPGEFDVQFEAIEVVVYRLRKKLLPTGATLTTLRGLGYLLKVGA